MFWGGGWGGGQVGQNTTFNNVIVCNFVGLGVWQVGSGQQRINGKFFGVFWGVAGGMHVWKYDMNITCIDTYRSPMWKMVAFPHVWVKR